jgi:prevent-host-death family protein
VKEISATEASRNFSKLLDEVEQGKSFNIVRGGQTVATVSPVKRYTGAAFTALLEELGPDPEFGKELEEARRYLYDQGPRYIDGP